MAGIDRTTIIAGPALVTYDSQSFWSKGDVIVKPVFKRFPIETAHFGKVDERFSDRRYEITFEPAGQFSDALAAVLWPYASLAIGSSIFGATDKALVVHGRDGKKITFHNTALTQMPGIRRAVDKTITAGLKFTALIAKSKDPTDAAAYFTQATASYPGDTGFSASDIFTLPATAAWGGSSPWSSFSSRDGWEVSFSLKLFEKTADGYGTFDMMLQGLDVSLKGTPMGPAVSDILTALKTAQALGSSLAGTNDFVISGGATGAPVFTLANAALVDADLGWGGSRDRIGTCEWIATRTVTAGAADPLFTIEEQA